MYMSKDIGLVNSISIDIYIYQWIVIHWLTGKIFKIPTCFCGKLYPTVRFYLLPHAILEFKATVLGTFIAEMGGGGGEEPIGLSNYLYQL